MNQNKEFPLAFIPEMDSQVLELPYVGKNLRMLIILPNEIQDETTGLQKVRQQRLYFIQHILNLFKIKVSKGFLCSEALEEIFLVFQIIFLHVKEPFSALKNLLWNVKAPWMLKLLHENIDANKEPLFYMD